MKVLGIVTGALLACSAACATAPKSAEDRQELSNDAHAALTKMLKKDPSLNGLLANSAGYAVFPEIGKGGFVVGGAYGRGILYERGRATGYVELNQGSLGAQIGAQTFTELIILKDRWNVEKLKSGDFTLGGNASAVILRTGAGAATDFVDGVAVVIDPRGGAMAELSLSGQKINFKTGG